MSARHRQAKRRRSEAEQERERRWQILHAIGEVCDYARNQGFGETFTDLLKPLTDRIVEQIAESNARVEACKVGRP